MVPKRVLIIQKALPIYRKEFFDSLKETLKEENIELSLVHGNRNREGALKKDEIRLPWSTFVPNRIFHLFGKEIYWQPVLSHVHGKELIIVEQANKLLVNYLLYIRRRFSKQKLAFWGHGRNLQSPIHSSGNRFKRLLINQCDWWFAYTEGVRELLTGNSFPSDRITVVQNAIDTKNLARQYAEVTENESARLKKELGIESDTIGIYCGGMYPEKRLEFLIEACDIIKKKISGFHLIIIGSGQQMGYVKNEAAKRDWIHYVGPKFGSKKVEYFKISSVFLMPGLVGLAILDAFAMQTPMITTDYPFHSPEIAYLEDGKSGLITSNNLESYAKAIIYFFQNESYRKQLIAGCLESGQQYSIEKMVENFKNGILKCLKN